MGYLGRLAPVVLLLSVAVAAALIISQHDRLATIGFANPTVAAPAGDGYQFVADIDNWQRTDRERVVSTPYNFNLAADLKQLPLQLGEWVGQDVPQTNLEVFILLEPDQYVRRLYRHPDGRYLWLSLIGSYKSKSFHSPQICYDTDGWQTDASSETITLDRGEMQALRLEATKRVRSGQQLARYHPLLLLVAQPSAHRAGRYGHGQSDRVPAGWLGGRRDRG